MLVVINEKVCWKGVPMTRFAVHGEDGSGAGATVGCRSDATMLVCCEFATEGTTLPVNLP